MNFILRVAKQYIKYCFCHKKIKFISSSHRVMFFLLYRHADDGISDNFPKISDHLLKISKDFPKLLRRPEICCRTFSDNFRKCPKIAEDFRGRPEDVSMIHQRIKYNLRDKLDINEIIDKLTCEIIENKPLVSRMYMWFLLILRVVYFPVKHSCLYNKNK